jgi:hypothetical protein
MKRRVAGWAAWFCAVFYLAQQLTLSPSPVDEGMTLSIIRSVAEGKRVFWDFFDVYGPMHYWPPAFFYVAFGKKVLGVRIWVLLVKISSVAAAYRLTLTAAEKLESWLAAMWTTALLGVAWQAMQTAYAFIHCVPFILLVQYLLISEPFPSRRTNAVVAGVLTAATLFIKVSSGAFLLAGGLLYCFCWSIPDNAPRDSSAANDRTPAWFRWAAPALALACGAAFLLFVRKKIDPLFYLYLDLPLVIAVALTLGSLRAEAREGVPVAHRIPFGFAYAGACGAAAGTFFLAYFGVSGGVRYVRELTTLFSGMSYEHPVLPLGQPGLYRGFTEYYWMQYPWLLTAACVAWVAVTRNGRGRAAFGDRWPLVRARAAGLWVFATLGMFAIFALGIEVHFLAAFLATGPSFFVLVSQIRMTAVRVGAPKPRGAIDRRNEILVAGAVVGWLSTIAYVPRLTPFVPRAGTWTVSPRGGHSHEDNRLEHLCLLETNRVGMRDITDEMTDTVIDRSENDTAMFLDEIAEDDEQVFMISQMELVSFHSFTLTPWERYRILFYYVREHIIDRPTFDRLVPADVIANVIRNPPRLALVDRDQRPRLLEVFPELVKVGLGYRVVKTFPTLVVLQRMDVEDPVPQ